MNGICDNLFAISSAHEKIMKLLCFSAIVIHLGFLSDCKSQKFEVCSREYHYQLEIRVDRFETIMKEIQIGTGLKTPLFGS